MVTSPVTQSSSSTTALSRSAQVCTQQGFFWHYNLFISLQETHLTFFIFISTVWHRLFVNGNVQKFFFFPTRRCFILFPLFYLKLHWMAFPSSVPRCQRPQQRKATPGWAEESSFFCPRVWRWACWMILVYIFFYFAFFICLFFYFSF